MLSAIKAGLSAPPSPSGILLLKRNPVTQIFDHNGKTINLYTEVDFSDDMKKNELRRREIGKGYSPTREIKEEWSCNQDVFLNLLANDGDVQEFWYTRTDKALRKMLQKYPWMKSSDGGV